MKITLNNLALKNFKGIRELSISFGEETHIYGDNATGKTTIFDAFLWLLFDKDSQNKKDFEIKTLDANGKVLPGLDHEVEAVLDLDGKKTVLRKVFSEKWTKKRGSATAEFTGHTTDYYLDGVPVKLKEFKFQVDEIGDENIFKLLTNPSYFNEVLDWKERRKVLLEIAGDVSDAEVIHVNDSLAKLPAVLNGHTLEDHRKVIAARRAEINKELDKIPVRIDEAEHSKPDVDGLDESVVFAQVETLRSQVEAQEAELTLIKSGGGIGELEKRLVEIGTELLTIKNKLQSDFADAIAIKKAVLTKASDEVDRLTRVIKMVDEDVESKHRLYESSEKDADKLRKEWVEVNSESFSTQVADTCVACGQPLPPERVQAAYDKALATFNQQKAERLESIVEKGQLTKASIEKYKNEIEALLAKKEALLREFGKAEDGQKTAQYEINRIKGKADEYASDPIYVQKLAEQEAVKARIETLRSSALPEIERVRELLINSRDELRRSESKLAHFTQIRTLDARIEELKAEERKLAAEYEDLEKQLYLTEEFIRTKVSLLESRINSKFRYARFKLFDTQINGGLQETCETLFDGVPYGSGLNNAARISIGLDIIETLSAHYDLWAPCFVDNAEAVTDLPKISSQMVALYVSENDKKLRVVAYKSLAKGAV